MSQQILPNHKRFERLLEQKQKAIGNFAKQVAEREWELMEFNLFVSASGKIEEASNSVKELRELEDKGKINLDEFDDIADDF